MSARPLHLAVDQATADLTADDRVLAAALVAAGVPAVPTIWGRHLPAGSRLLVRSTWDYVDRPDEFSRWLDRLDDAGVTVHNPTSVLRWNMHKGYLCRLRSAGLPTVPTLMAQRGSVADLASSRDELGAHRLVIKPAIGGTARLTVDTGRAGEDDATAHLETLLEVEDVIIQPYVDSIVDTGEVSIVAIGGQVTHAVRKRARVGEWRVQSDFGGTTERVDVTAEFDAIATAALELLGAASTYARIDVVEVDGAWLVLELELVEPELFFADAPEAAARLAGLMADPTWHP